MKSSVTNIIREVFVGKKITKQFGIPEEFWNSVITDVYPNTDPCTGNTIIVVTVDKYQSSDYNFFVIHPDFEMEVE